MHIDKNRVGKLLKGLSTIDTESVSDKKGNLDVRKFNGISAVQYVISELKGLGVNKSWLFDNGFVPAGMILYFGEEK